MIYEFEKIRNSKRDPGRRARNRARKVQRGRRKGKTENQKQKAVLAQTISFQNNNSMEVSVLDIKQVKKEAEEEVQKERLEKAKKQIKKKLQEIEAAKLCVRNLERELEDLYVEISE